MHAIGSAEAHHHLVSALHSCRGGISEASRLRERVAVALRTCQAAAAATAVPGGRPVWVSAAALTASAAAPFSKGSKAPLLPHSHFLAAFASSLLSPPAFASGYTSGASDGTSQTRRGEGSARAGAASQGEGLNGASTQDDSKYNKGIPKRVVPIEPPPYKVYAPDNRIVAIGDLHGDFEVTKEALRIAGVLSPVSEDGHNDSHLYWIGGSTLVVQVGDILDRGEDEIAILSLLRNLDLQARDVGGRVFQINGNHETMNVAEEFRYVTEGGFEECGSFAQFCIEECSGDWDSAFQMWWHKSQHRKRKTNAANAWAVAWNPLQMRRLMKARSILFRVGGPIARELSRHGVSLLINDILFAHGGVLPHHVDHGLQRMNNEVCRWMRGERDRFGERQPIPFIATKGFDSIVWSRLYSQEFFASTEELYTACAVLSSTLDAAGASRLVVGHTPQMGGANSACNGRVWRIDVGMSSGMMSATPQVLEFVGDIARVLSRKEEALQPSDART